MMKIAVVDDENLICSQVERYLLEIAKELHLKMDIDVFYSGRQLCQYLEQNVCYDVIFLDIEMDDVNGITASDFIRQKLLDDGVQIVYVSGKTQYAMELFQYSPLDFLVKPVDYARLRQVMIKISRTAGLWSDTFSYRKNHETVKVKMRDILYLENIRRKIRIVTQNGEDEFYASMEEAYSQLEHFGFICIHRSYIVNYRHVKIFRYSDVVMMNGSVLPIGRSRRAQVQELQLKMESRDIYDS